jgi:ABC-type phosphate/phosphonate transport system substrate-binding protein
MIFKHWIGNWDQARTDIRNPRDLRGFRMSGFVSQEVPPGLLWLCPDPATPTQRTPMIGRRRTFLSLAAALGLAVLPALAPGQTPQAPPVKIGMAGSLFRDVPASMIQLLTPPFQSLMRDQTGLEGEIVPSGTAVELGKKLSDKEVQLGVFHGFEFAWAQEKYPELKPLCIVINKHRTLRALLVVRGDSEATALADLKGKTIAVPRRTREHCHLFLEREVAPLVAEGKEFFGKIVNHASIEDALDDVLRDKVQAVLVDGVALESYEQVKPGCHAQLKVLKQSEPFPPSVVVYRDAAVDKATLAKFRDGMINANQTVRGKELMAQWKLTAFENVPDDFPQALASVLKAYPPPGGKTK